MDIDSPGPFRVTSLLWQPRPRVLALTVICRATFHLVPAVALLADDQDSPAEEDNHWDDDPSRSLYAPSDLVPFKPRADVLLVGNAFAPRKDPVRSLMVRMLVGEVDKSIEVFADRSFGLDGQLREGPRFSRMPLRYERAAGGPDTDNPVGVRLDARDGHGVCHIPNLQPPGLFITQPGEAIGAIGFGPIAPRWPSRRERLGRHAGVWPPSRTSGWSERPLPTDIDAGYFNSAPRDQQLEALRDDERIILENLHPEHPRLVTSLPGLRPRAMVERVSVPAEELQLSADTLWIDTDRSLCTVTWRGQVRVEHPDEAGRVHVTLDTRRRSLPDLSWSSGDAESAEAGQTLVPHRRKAAVLPFVDARQREPPTASASQPWIGTDAELGATTMSLVGDLDAIEAQADGPEETQSLGVDAMNAMLSDARGRPNASSSMPFVPAAAAPPHAAAPALAPPNPPRPPPAAPTRPRAPSTPPSARPFVPPPKPSAPVFGPPPSPVAASPVHAPPAAETAPPALVRPSVQVHPIAPAATSSPWGQADPRASAHPTTARESPDDEEPRPSPRPSPTPAPDASAPKASGREVVQLLWFHEASPAKIRKQRAWKALIRALEERRDNEEGDDDELPAEGSPDHWDHRCVEEVLIRAHPLQMAGVREAWASAVDEDGKYRAPLVLLAGELLFPFDELATLKATVTAVSPLIAGDKKLKEVVDTVLELLKTPWLEGSGRIAEGLTERLKEAFGQGKRMLPPDYLESHTERILLSERQYQRRTVLGQGTIRSLLRPGPSADVIPTYLPDKLAKELPMFQRFGARLVAEVTMQQDQYESSPLALQVLALARVMPLPRV